jgi:hypothetical protein
MVPPSMNSHSRNVGSNRSRWTNWTPAPSSLKRTLPNPSTNAAGPADEHQAAELEVALLGPLTELSCPSRNVTRGILVQDASI